MAVVFGDHADVDGILGVDDVAFEHVVGHRLGELVREGVLGAAAALSGVEVAHRDGNHEGVRRDGIAVVDVGLGQAEAVGEHRHRRGIAGDGLLDRDLVAIVVRPRMARDELGNVDGSHARRVVGVGKGLVAIRVVGDVGGGRSLSVGPGGMGGLGIGLAVRILGQKRVDHVVVGDLRGDGRVAGVLGIDLHQAIGAVVEDALIEPHVEVAGIRVVLQGIRAARAGKAFGLGHGGHALVLAGACARLLKAPLVGHGILRNLLVDAVVEALGKVVRGVVFGVGLHERLEGELDGAEGVHERACAGGGHKVKVVHALIDWGQAVVGLAVLACARIVLMIKFVTAVGLLLDHPVLGAAVVHGADGSQGGVVQDVVAIRAPRDADLAGLLDALVVGDGLIPPVGHRDGQKLLAGALGLDGIVVGDRPHAQDRAVVVLGHQDGLKGHRVGLAVIPAAVNAASALKLLGNHHRGLAVGAVPRQVGNLEARHAGVGGRRVVGLARIEGLALGKDRLLVAILVGVGAIALKRVVNHARELPGVGAVNARIGIDAGLVVVRGAGHKAVRHVGHLVAIRLAVRVIGHALRRRACLDLGVSHVSLLDVVVHAKGKAARHVCLNVACGGVVSVVGHVRVGRRVLGGHVHRVVVDGRHRHEAH